MKKEFKRILAFFLALISILSICFFSLSAFASGNDAEIYDSLDDLEGKRIGIFSGTVYDQISEKTWNNVEFVYVNSFGDAILALKSNKIDTFIADEPFAKYVISQNDGLTYIPEAMDTQKLAFAFAKDEHGQSICNEFNQYLDKWNEDGTIAEIMDTWADIKKENPKIDLNSLTGENGTIKLATCAENPPFEYIENGECVGYEIDLVYRYCKDKGYALEISNMNFDSLIPSVTNGKADICACGIGITEERQQSVLFSSSICDNRVIPMISTAHSKEGATTNNSSFLNSIIASIKKTFIAEDRWKLFVSGIELTLLITIASMFFGTLLGFILYMWYWSGRKIAKWVTNFFDWLMNRMPMVVLLMILFFVVFGKTNISGSIVSIIGFTLVFGSSVYGLLKSGVNAIDPGQMEAGLALGYKPTRAFFKIVFPQAAQQFMPGYKGEIISLIKSTAIVGYVAVQDLTKVGDIVRSRTYEAFFPLVVTALIYIILAELLILIVKIFEKRFMPSKNKKSKLLKGVKTDD